MYFFVHVSVVYKTLKQCSAETAKCHLMGFKVAGPGLHNKYRAVLVGSFDWSMIVMSRHDLIATSAPP